MKIAGFKFWWFQQWKQGLETSTMRMMMEYAVETWRAESVDSNLQQLWNKMTNRWGDHWICTVIKTQILIMGTCLVMFDIAWWWLPEEQGEGMKNRVGMISKKGGRAGWVGYQVQPWLTTCCICMAASSGRRLAMWPGMLLWTVSLILLDKYAVYSFVMPKVLWMFYLSFCQVSTKNVN